MICLENTVRHEGGKVCEGRSLSVHLYEHIFLRCKKLVEAPLDLLL